MLREKNTLPAVQQGAEQLQNRNIERQGAELQKHPIRVERVVVGIAQQPDQAAVRENYALWCSGRAGRVHDTGRPLRIAFRCGNSLGIAGKPLGHDAMHLRRSIESQGAIGHHEAWLRILQHVKDPVARKPGIDREVGGTEKQRGNVRRHGLELPVCDNRDDVPGNDTAGRKYARRGPGGRNELSVGPASRARRIAELHRDPVGKPSRGFFDLVPKCDFCRHWASNASRVHTFRIYPQGGFHGVSISLRLRWGVAVVRDCIWKIASSRRPSQVEAILRRPMKNGRRSPCARGQEQPSTHKEIRRFQGHRAAPNPQRSPMPPESSRSAISRYPNRCFPGAASGDFCCALVLLGPAGAPGAFVIPTARDLTSDTHRRRCRPYRYLHSIRRPAPCGQVAGGRICA